jgi:hypothetical protein
VSACRHSGRSGSPWPETICWNDNAEVAFAVLGDFFSTFVMSDEFAAGTRLAGRWRDIGIEFQISQEELSDMIGTTTPRIIVFGQRFENIGPDETNKGCLRIIKEPKLTTFLAQIAESSCPFLNAANFCCSILDRKLTRAAIL